MDQSEIANGQFFRAAWIAGVKRHYPEVPKESYIAPWDQIGTWEQESASAVYKQVSQLVTLSDGKTTHLSREQKGRFVSLCWIAQIFKHIPNPKPSYVADWDELPEWQQKTDADIFEAIERLVLQGA